MTDESPPAPPHQPVMVEEVLRRLDPSPGEVVLDATVGAGGHAVELLRHLGPTGVLLGIDRDADVLRIAAHRLRAVGGTFHLFHGIFVQIPDFLRSLGREPGGALDGVLFDLGVSSFQLDQPDRGFSFLLDGPLSMRMDASAGETAAELLERISVEELQTLLREFGEERAAKRIARSIDRHRKERRIETTRELANIVEDVLPRAGRKIHPATRTFQALRIAVNRELEYLRLALQDLDRFMRPGGRVVVLSYHSLEDREVKRNFRTGVQEGIYRWNPERALRPSGGEIASNPRARSARLRSVIRSGGGVRP